MSATDEPVHGVNIRVKSLSHYGFVSCRREVSGGQMEALFKFSAVSARSSVGTVARCQVVVSAVKNLPDTLGFVLLGCRRVAGILM